MANSYDDYAGTTTLGSDIFDWGNFTAQGSTKGSPTGPISDEYRSREHTREPHTRGKRAGGRHKSRPRDSNGTVEHESLLPGTRADEKAKTVRTMDSLAPYKALMAVERATQRRMLNLKESDERLSTVVSIRFNGTPEQLDEGASKFALSKQLAVDAFSPMRHQRIVKGTGNLKSFEDFDQTRAIVTGVKVVDVTSSLPFPVQLIHSAQPRSHTVTADGSFSAMTIQSFHNAVAGSRVIFDGSDQLENPALSMYGAQTVQSLKDRDAIVKLGANMCVQAANNPLYNLIEAEQKKLDFEITAEKVKEGYPLHVGGGLQQGRGHVREAVDEQHAVHGPDRVCGLDPARGRHALFQHRWAADEQGGEGDLFGHAPGRCRGPGDRVRVPADCRRRIRDGRGGWVRKLRRREIGVSGCTMLPA